MHNDHFILIPVTVIVYIFLRVQEQCAEIDKQNKEMRMVMQELERQVVLKDGMLSSFMPALV